LYQLKLLIERQCWSWFASKGDAEAFDLAEDETESRDLGG